MRAGIQQREDLVLIQGNMIRAIGPSFVLFERVQPGKSRWPFHSRKPFYTTIRALPAGVGVDDGGDVREAGHRGEPALRVEACLAAAAWHGRDGGVGGHGGVPFLLCCGVQ